MSICKAVNAVGVCDRSIEDVKETWRNLTKKAKAEFTSQRISMMKTGGGSSTYDGFHVNGHN